jgi:hypothetical protein
VTGAPDPAQTLTITAFCGLIDRQLCNDTSPVAASAARKLVAELVTSTVANHRQTPMPDRSLLQTLTMCGVRVEIRTHSALTLLRHWQRQALQQIHQPRKDR